VLEVKYIIITTSKRGQLLAFSPVAALFCVYRKEIQNDQSRTSANIQQQSKRPFRFHLYEDQWRRGYEAGSQNGYVAGTSKG
jgi:hypothetical protein